MKTNSYTIFQYNISAETAEKSLGTKFQQRAIIPAKEGQVL